MSVDRDEVSRIAALARLELDPEEVERLTADMNRILEHAAHLGGVASHAEVDGAEVDSPQSRGSPRHQEAFGGSGHGASPDGSDKGVGGGRVGGAGVPDRLAAPLQAWGPRVEEGFFVVPPLPGTRPGESS